METKKKWIVSLTLLLSLCSLVCGCFPTYKAVKIDIDTLKSGKDIAVQTKVFTKENDIYLFEEGFSCDEYSIYGRAIVHEFGQYTVKSEMVQIQFDSIVAMINYEETTSGTRHFGSFLFGLTAPFLTFSGIYCIACPKCCFGSCPTIYSNDGNNYNMEAELFSECISKQLKNQDIDVLKQRPVNESLTLKITNEALETHYIDRFNLFVAEHPLKSRIYPNSNNGLTVINKAIPSRKIISKGGLDVADLLAADDDNYYRSGVEKISEIKDGPAFDYLDVELPEGSHNSLKMVIKYRNTLLSTTLLYDIVLGSQGVEGIEWTRKMNEDPIYASQFKMIYDTFSGIKLKLLKGSKFKHVATLKDAGPLSWKYLSAEINLEDMQSGILRLEFIPDNFMIDYVEFDTSKTGCEDYSIRKINPANVSYQNRTEIDSLVKYLDEKDNLYLVTEPGDSYKFDYCIPSNNNRSQTLLIYSEGYYNEWIRGSWIREKYDYSFDLYNIKETLSVLADSWIENSSILEEKFFESRIILKEEK